MGELERGEVIGPWYRSGEQDRECATCEGVTDHHVVEDNSGFEYRCQICGAERVERYATPSEGRRAQLEAIEAEEWSERTLGGFGVDGQPARRYVRQTYDHRQIFKGTIENPETGETFDTYQTSLATAEDRLLSQWHQ